MSKFKVSPLFFAFGVYFALTGRIFVFLVYTWCAVIHELGHSFVAGKYGYRLNEIILMPFGAVIKGDTENLKCRDETLIALAGPLTNLSVGLFFVSLWWIIPEIYAFTDTAVMANFAIALVNFIPAYPLDGGRILYSLIRVKKGKRAAEITCKTLGAILGLTLFLLFILSCFKEVNLSLLFFSLFVIFGTFKREKGSPYIRIYSSITEEKLKRGIEVKRQAVSKEITVKKLISLLEENAVNEIDVYGENDKIGTINQREIERIIEKASIYDRLDKYV